jgi:hypothetical protein
MDTSHEIAAFCEGILGPDKLTHHADRVRQSGLTTPILGFLHIGRPEIPGQSYGDLIYNDYPDDLLVSYRGSEPVFNPNGKQVIQDWPNQVAQLKKYSSVNRIFISIGGDGKEPADVRDFRTIQHMFQSGQREILRTNLEKLREVFTFNNACVIDGIDINCEEFDSYIPPPGVEDSTIVNFSTMLFELGFKVTFNPWNPPDRKRWQDCMQALLNKGHEVSWWNLQCYDGGRDNRDNLQEWINSLATVVGKDNAASYLMPGLSVRGAKDGQCPSTNNRNDPGILETFAGWRNLGLRGGWLWSYDEIFANYNKGLCPGDAVLYDYVQAVKKGLG